jgi:citrate synthase
MMSSLKVAARRGVRLAQSVRNASSLKDTLAAQIPAKQEEMKKLKKEYGNYSLGEVTVDQAIGGGRDVKCMYYETSLLDAHEVGVHFI